MYDTSKLRLLAQGGQADIYELGEDKVLRVIRDAKHKDLAEVEYSVLCALHEQGRDVPKAYEFTSVDGKPALVVERIKGPSMLDTIGKNPLKMKKWAREFARLHHEVLLPADIPNVRRGVDREKYIISHSELLNDAEKKFAFTLHDAMPDGNILCHADFHPGNILMSNGRYYIIDWFGAYAGSAISDVAHTYLLMRNVPRIPGQSALQHRLLRYAGGKLARVYLMAYYKLAPFDWGEFSKWTAVKAAERTFRGQPGEEVTLLHYLKQCMDAQARGVDPALWWKML